MDTTTAQPTQDSYADAYVPPANAGAPVEPVMQVPVAAAAPVAPQPVMPQPVVTYTPPTPMASPVEPVMSQAQPMMPTEPVASVEPVAPVAPVAPTSSFQQTEPQLDPITPVAQESVAQPVPAADPAQSEALADQNIFEMLGVTTGTPEQREQFLDELQQVIWDDFLEHDVKLLLTEQEQADLDQILGSSSESTLEQQEKIVVFLEKLIPDLEDIMLEKALQLKAEMARERLSALKELHRNEPEKMAIIETAEQQMSQDLWRSATVSLSTVG